MSTTKRDTDPAGRTVGRPAEVRPARPWKGLALTFAGFAGLFLATTLWGVAGETGR